MRVLVTGGLGVNGSWVTRNLLDRGHDVVVFESSLDTRLVGDVAGEIALVEGDVRDLDALERAMSEHRVDRVVHMAAMVQGCQQAPRDAFAINATGTVNVHEAAVRSDVPRVVLASSRAVYGSAQGPWAHPQYRPFHEDDPVRPTLVYDTCKVAGEAMARNYSDVFGLDVVALRFAHIVGPGKSARYTGHSVCSRLIDEPLAGRPLVVERGGDQRDDIIYIADAAEGVARATLADVSGFRVYNISRGIATTLGDLADAVRRVIPDADITIGPGLDYMGAGQQWYGPLSNARAREELGFEPRFDLDGLVADYVRRVRETDGAGRAASGEPGRPRRAGADAARHRAAGRARGLCDAGGGRGAPDPG
jgi:UDP-glucose 4-epimerase